MLAAFADLTVERKLRLLMVMTAVTALLAAGLGYGLSDFVLFRRTIVEETRSLADVLGSSSVGALEFEDRRVAQETLSFLALRDNIAAAGLYGPSGELLAGYRRPGVETELPERLDGTDRHAFRAGHLDLERPVRFQGRRLGGVFLQADMSELYQRAAWFALTALAVLLFSTVLAFAVASRLQGVVSNPILRLVQAVRRVSRSKDYSVRVEKDSEDEIGLLIDGFNEMIAQIERHDADRESARRQLARQAADLARSNAELGDFAYIASHDLKEPLRGIHSYSRFLLEDYGDVVDDEGREKLQTLVRLTIRMEKLINMLLHYSRLERTEDAVEPTDLEPVLHEVLDTLGPSIEERGVEVRIVRPLPRVVCDGSRVAEVFRNLVTNAIKYNDRAEKWIEIDWRCGAKPAPGAHVAIHGFAYPDHPVFCVRDNGIGIRDRHLEAIFRIFKRLHGRDRYGGGTGAGLGIVKKIVEQHEGRLWVESTHGEGTAFHFSVGALDGEKDEEAAG